MRVAEYVQRLSRINPVDFQDVGTQAHLGAVGAGLDDLATRAYTAMLARLILLAPEDALLLAGAERGLRRFPSESVETYRTRVVDAWRFWELAGTLAGMKQALASAGYRATIVEHFRDPDPRHWAEFSVTVSPLNPLPNDAHWNGQRRWGDGARWGVDPNAVPTDYLVDLIREVKPAHARLRQLSYFPRGRYWGSDAEWGEGRLDSPVTGWGFSYALPDYVEQSTDSGPRWGTEPGVVLYRMEG
ncbi:phage tail protein [Deinococcus ruber]|uniref:Uncharacterized protein n=1 Tax=Deinococcus ruber TaxID=1848197 RepID=A0A918F222_9DEIO|nr:phage tail protein [Deinococcus ruber]GGR00350.1 hypothetical protein GCM10008957_11410 [Deinococcus ruber]